MMASPLITASQSHDASIRSRPSTNTSLGLTGRAATARASAHSDARRMLSRSMREGGAGANPGIELLSRLRIQLFRVIEAARHALGIENDRRRDNRTGKRPPACLVATRNRPDAAFECRPLATKGRAHVLLAERQAHDADGLCATRCCATVCDPTHGAMVRAAGDKSTVAGSRM